MSGRIVIIDTDWQTMAVPGTGAAAQDILEVKLAATQFGFLHAAYIMQHSEEASTEAEEIKVAIKRGNGYTSGSVGVPATVTKGATGDAANGLSVARQKNTTQAVAGGGSLEVIMPGVFNVLAGEWERVWTPELRPPFGPSEGIIFSVEEAFADTAIVRAILILELYGT